MLGDLVGRKNTFLVTMAIMGLSTFIVGLLPSYASAGVIAPIALVALRLLQGLAALLGNISGKAPVQIVLDDGGVLSGTLDRVGADYVELAEHPALVADLERRHLAFFLALAAVGAVLAGQVRNGPLIVSLLTYAARQARAQQP